MAVAPPRQSQRPRPPTQTAATPPAALQAPPRHRWLARTRSGVALVFIVALVGALLAVAVGVLAVVLTLAVRSALTSA